MISSSTSNQNALTGGWRAPTDTAMRLKESMTFSGTLKLARKHKSSVKAASST
jgi:hypothetical protein